MDLGILLLRVVVGLLLAGHGAQKAFGWFGGHGFAGTRGFFGGMLRFRPAGFWTTLAVLAELGGGLLFAAGLLSPLGALALIAAMLVATVVAHWPRFWVTDGGIEYPLVLIAAAAAIGLTGPGAFSLDNALGIALPAPATFVVGLAAVIVGTVVALATRAPQPTAQAQPDAPREDTPQPKAA
jgi:putative oxidoreductase